MNIQVAKAIAQSIMADPRLFFLQPVVTNNGINLWYQSTLKAKISADMKIHWNGIPIEDAEQRLMILLRRANNKGLKDSVKGVG